MRLTVVACTSLALLVTMRFAVVPSLLGVAFVALFDTRRDTHKVPTHSGLTDRQLFLDSTCGGGCPFLVGGVVCPVNSVDERDLRLLNSAQQECWFHYLLERLCVPVDKFSMEIQASSFHV